MQRLAWAFALGCLAFACFSDAPPFPCASDDNSCPTGLTCAAAEGGRECYWSDDVRLVGGTTSNLLGSGLILSNATSEEDLAVLPDAGTFTFSIPLPSGASYAVTVKAQPTAPEQLCTVSNGAGTVMNGPITGIAVACTTGPTWIAVAAREYNSAAMRSDGTVWTWGRNNAGQLGIGNTTDSLVPVQVDGGGSYFLPEEKGTLAVGNEFMLGLTTNGTLLAWGANDAGQLGTGDLLGEVAPDPIADIDEVAAVAAGGFHTLALTRDGTLHAWGYNGCGQLGNGSATTEKSPVTLDGGVTADGGRNTYISIAAGFQHSAAIAASHTLWTWGINANGRLGLGDPDGGCWRVPVAVPGHTFTSVATGYTHTVAIEVDGGIVWAWGNNESHQLGVSIPDGGSSAYAPLAVTPPGVTYIFVAAGRNHTLALRDDGTLMAWGGNGYGQLGTGDTTLRDVPAPVGSGFKTVAAGAEHSMGIKKDGTLWVWGRNTYGQLGTGDTASRLVPTQLK